MMDIADCQLPILILNAEEPKIGNRQLEIGNAK
jgi:hypothetical protein